MDTTEPPASLTGQNDEETTCKSKQDCRDFENSSILMSLSVKTMEAPQIIQALTEGSDDVEAIEQEDGCTDAEDGSSDKVFKILNGANVLKKIANFANQEELYKLRQVNERFYKLLNPTFFTTVGPFVSFSNIPMIIGANPSNNEEENIPDLESILANPAINETEIFLSPGGETKWKAETFKIVHNKPAHSVKIPLDQLPAYKQIFRGMCLWFFKFNLELVELFSQFHPYISTIVLSALRFPELEDWTLLKFINQFTNLEEFNLFYALHPVANANMELIPSDELETLLDNLTAKPKISIYLAAQHEEILEKFGVNPNLNFVIAFLVSNDDSLAVLQKYTNVLNQFNFLTNLKFDCTFIKNFYANESRINNMDDLRTLTTLWTQQWNGEKFDLELGIELIPQNFPDENEVKECLKKLSRFIEQLNIIQMDNNKQGVVSMDCNWPNLVKLELDGYKHSLEILKNCPKLKSLSIVNLDYQSSVFANSDQSMEQSLLEYFGNLAELENLTLSPIVDAGIDTNESIAEKNIITINGLDEYLQGLFPKLESYKNLTPIIYTI